MKVTNIVYRGGGATITYSDGSTSEATYIYRNNKLTITGITPQQLTALNEYKSTLPKESNLLLPINIPDIPEIPEINQPNGVAGLDANGAVEGRNQSTILNVKHFGAVGNGTTDDAEAIQAALDAADNAGGGTVWLPEGTYGVGTDFVLPAKVRLHGAGSSVTTIKLLENADLTNRTLDPFGFAGGASSNRFAVIITDPEANGGFAGEILKGFTIDFNDAEQDIEPFTDLLASAGVLVAGVLLYQADNAVIADIGVKNVFYDQPTWGSPNIFYSIGILVSHSKDVSTYHCRVERVGYEGIGMRNGAVGTKNYSPTIINAKRHGLAYQPGSLNCFSYGVSIDQRFAATGGEFRCIQHDLGNNCWTIGGRVDTNIGEFVRFETIFAPHIVGSGVFGVRAIQHGSSGSSSAVVFTGKTERCSVYNCSLETNDVDNVIRSISTHPHNRVDGCTIIGEGNRAISIIDAGMKLEVANTLINGVFNRGIVVFGSGSVMKARNCRSIVSPSGSQAYRVSGGSQGQFIGCFGDGEDEDFISTGSGSNAQLIGCEAANGQITEADSGNLDNELPFPPTP